MITDAEHERFAYLKRIRDTARCPTKRIYAIYAICRLSAEIGRRRRQP